MSSRASRLGKNTLLVFLGNMGSKLIGFLMLPFYTHWLSTEGYGLADVLSVYVSFLIYLVTFSIGDALFIFPKDANKEGKTTFFSTGLSFMLLSFLVTSIIFFFIELLAADTDFHNSFTDNIWLIYFMLLSQALQQTLQQFTRSIDKMKVYSITGIVCTACTALYAFLLIPNHGVSGYIWSIVLANLTAALYTSLFSGALKFYNPMYISKQSLTEMLRYSVPLIPNGVMWWLVNALNRPIMEQNIGFQDIGIYAVANKFPALLTMVFSVFVTSWQISVIEEFGKDGYSTFYNKVFHLVFSLLLITFLSITLISKPLIMVFADADFYEAWKYVSILTLGVFFSNIAGFVGVNFSATRESKYYFYSSIASAVSAVILNFILIPLYGLWGTCISLLLSFVVMAISRLAFSWKYVKIENKTIYIIYILLATIYMILNILEVNIFINIFAFIGLIAYIAFREKQIINMVVCKIKGHIKQIKI